MQALLKVLGASFLLAVVVMAILATAALGVLPRDAAVYAASAVFVVGALVIARQFTRILVRQQLSRDDSAEPDSLPDGPRD